MDYKIQTLNNSVNKSEIWRQSFKSEVYLWLMMGSEKKRGNWVPDNNKSLKDTILTRV